MSIESKLQTGSLKNICTYCNTILHLTETRKRVSDRRWQSDRDYCCIPEDNATNIRNLLARGGMDVIGVCSTGAQAMHYADTVDNGIVVCGYRMKDMMYTQLREYLPDSFEMLLIASQDKWSSGDVEGIVGLSTPIKVYDLMNTMNMMLQSMDRKRKKRKKESKNRDPKQQETIRRAKELLMERNNMSEGEAHRYLQKSSMDSGTNMVETAEMVLSVMAE